MSLVLKGEWHMPKKCRHCLFCKPYETRASMGSGICLATGKRLAYGETPSNSKGAGRFCPLVELPERHGRLIDADALISDHFSPEHRIALSEANKTWMRKIINDAPTIVEAEAECG